MPMDAIQKEENVYAAEALLKDRKRKVNALLLLLFEQKLIWGLVLLKFIPHFHRFFFFFFLIEDISFFALQLCSSTDGLYEIIATFAYCNILQQLSNNNFIYCSTSFELKYWSRQVGVKRCA